MSRWFFPACGLMLAGALLLGLTVDQPPEPNVCQINEDGR